MKKTLMVLSFALCATFVFAQTATPNKNVYMAKSETSNVSNMYQSSIFTKDATPLVTVDFSGDNLGYTTGVYTTGVDAHTQNYDYARWQRWANVDTNTTVVAMTEMYPHLVSRFASVSSFKRAIVNYLDTAVSSGENGFMMIDYDDQTSLGSGKFNAYIQVANINVPTGTPVLDVQFYQYYIKYYDQCKLEYSTDGTNYTSIDINVDGIDCSINSSMQGFVTYTLPVAAVATGNLSIRLRAFSSGERGSAYGYWWIVDDLSVIPGDANRVRPYAQEYTEGGYGLIPQGLTVNPAWYSLVYNNGANILNDIYATLNHMNAGQDVTTPVATYNNGSVAVSAWKELIVDKAGWFWADSLDYRGWMGYADHNLPHGTGNALPTETAGDNYMYVNIANDNFSFNYDTMYYNVTTLEDGAYRWGHDNGVLAYMPDNYFLWGFVQNGPNWYVTDDPQEVHYYTPGYMITDRFTTDANVPEGWVIRGVELVASPVDGYHSTGSKISAVLYEDQYEGGSVGFQSVMTGANIKTITDDDVNNESVIGRESNGYLELGNYNTVIINFPEQPALQPYTSYRVGYSVEEHSFFALAQEAQGRYCIASPSHPDTHDTIIYFRNSEATAKYANHYEPNQYQIYFNDPSYGGPNRGSGFTWDFLEYNPMIRLLVGPAQAINRVNISIECENDGDFGTVSYGAEEACGTTITPAQGSTATIVAQANAGCEAVIIVDGVERQVYDETEGIGDPNLVAYYDDQTDEITYYYSFAEVSHDHTIKFVFRERVSIDPVASSVRMNLQPNPATSQVKLNISGVSGMVNCSLIDMSGRVVYNQNINAESAPVINLSNLAKGAYFVRITNNQFSKIEKLIVR